MTVDVIIPTYKPDQEYFTLIEMLQKQTVPVQKIIVINTEEKYFNGLVFGRRYKNEYKNVMVKHISSHEFDHGGTRRRAVKESDADVFVMMTQDAIPADEDMLKRLLAPLSQEDVAVSYARQLAKEDAGEIEKYTRQFNYPDEPVLKGQSDIETMGIKTFFVRMCAQPTKERSMTGSEVL